MKIETQELENHQIKLVVEIDQTLLDEAKRRAASNLAKHTKIPGFRPGKAPYTMVVMHLGEAVILEDAIELLIDDMLSVHAASQGAGQMRPVYSGKLLVE